MIKAVNQDDHHGSGTYIRWMSYGVRLAVRSTIALPEEKVFATLPPGTFSSSMESDLIYTVDEEATTTQGNAKQFSLYRDTERIYEADSLEWLLYALQNDSEWQVAIHAPEYGFVHAGAVAYGGQGVVLPGVSGAGKSTLVSQLLTRRATYYSDEYAVLDAQGLLYPFPCLLKLKDRPEGVWRPGPEEFGASVGSGPVRIRLVAFPIFSRGTPLHVECLEAGQAALHLLQHMPATRLRPDQILATAGKVFDNVICVTLHYDESARAADYLLELIERHGAVHGQFVF